MSRRPARALLLVAAVAALAGGIAVPAANAVTATGPLITVTPADNLDANTSVQITLTGATAFDGQQVGFYECNTTVNSTLPANDQYGEACTSLSGGLTVTNGAASSGGTITDGTLQPGAPVTADCTDATNGECGVVALVFSPTTEVASTPITFEPPQTPAVTATPSTNLTDGSAVHVSASGIPSNESPVYIAQCNTAYDESLWLSGNQYCTPLDYTPGTVVNHAYSATDKVTYGAAGCDESASCVIAVLYYSSTSSSLNQVVATTPISFATPATMVSIEPTSGLKDGQRVTVSASGVPAAWQSFLIDECDPTYVASHGGFGQSPNQPGCLTIGVPGTFSNGAMTTTAQVTEGHLDYYDASSPLCDYATNGNCEIVLLQPNSGPVSFAPAQPITFRAPVTGPGTFGLSHSTGLFNEAPVVVGSLADIKDGINAVRLLECNKADVAKRGYGTSCVGLANLTVTNNAIPKTTVRVAEGTWYTTATKTSTCDPTHACETGLFVDHGSSKYTLASNLVPLGFRNPNRGTPAVSLSSARGLKRGQRITATVTKVSDLDTKISFQECNVKAGHGKYQIGVNCKILTPPGSILEMYDGKGREKVKVTAGSVGETENTGRHIDCNASTNGQCAVVAVANAGNRQKFLAKSRAITFAK